MDPTYTTDVTWEQLQLPKHVHTCLLKSHGRVAKLAICISGADVQGGLERS